MRRRLPFLLAPVLLAHACGSRSHREEARAPQPEPEDSAAAEDAGAPVEGPATDAADAPPPAVEPEPDPPLPPPRRLVVQAAGDYILHPRVHNSARFHAQLAFDPDIAATEGYAYLIHEVKPVLARGDLNLFNLETPLATERNPQSGDPPMLNGPPIAAVSLARAGFHVASIANNHAYDQDLEGVVETRAACEEAGVAMVGGGAEADAARAPVFVERSGVKVGILAYTLFVNRTTLVNRTSPDVPQVAIWRGDADLETVRSVRRQCDILIVMMHWGDEFATVPNRSQRAAAADLCAAGVDIVVGTHSHTLQQVSRLPGPDESTCVVAYSLGNFLSNQGLKYRVGWTNPNPDRAQGIGQTRDTAILRVVYEEDPEGRLQVATLQAVPLWTENNWLDRFGVPDFQNDIYVAPLFASMRHPERSARYASLYAERLEEIRRALGPDVEIVEE
jgi:poly-gamma-glutamate synthesis protein (capsule biosynthesis protein)